MRAVQEATNALIDGTPRVTFSLKDEPTDGPKKLDPVSTTAFLMAMTTTEKDTGIFPMRKFTKSIFALILLTFLLILIAVNPREVDVTESVVIDGNREEIWRAVTDFEGSFHESNTAHLSTTITSEPSAPFREGLTFTQVETVGGYRGALDGRVYDVYPKDRYRWSADTTYRVLGIDLLEIQEGGDLRIEATRTGPGLRLSHRVYGQFPDTIGGRMASWFMSALLDIEADAAHHTLVELNYIKNEVESDDT
ncbi:hypothetical protein ACFOZ5_01605 [Marinobacter lacisalsi]|uniref:Uncharacterized protein n=1 Tax=Marinobacter lacisalsi TaxID=475979 RepID=A0ABV8QBL4_9GAMM